MKNLIFLIAGAVIALTSYFLGSGKIGFSDQGKYHLSSPTPQIVWRINSETGQLSWCIGGGGVQPQCGPWSKNGKFLTSQAPPPPKNLIPDDQATPIPKGLTRIDPTTPTAQSPVVPAPPKGFTIIDPTQNPDRTIQPKAPVGE